MYGIDLIGATFGSIAIPLLLYPFGLMGTISFMAVLAIIPFLYYVITIRAKPIWSAIIYFAPFLILSVLWASGSFHVKYAAGFGEKNLIREYWSPMSRVRCYIIGGKRCTLSTIALEAITRPKQGIH